MNTQTLLGMTASAVIGLSGTALGCYTNNFEAGTLGLAEVFGDAAIDNNALMLTPDVNGSSGAIVFPLHGQTIRQFDASFDYRLDPQGTLGGANLIVALGDLTKGTVSAAETLSGLAVNIRAANIGAGFGNFVYVSVWLDGMAILPEGDSGFILPTTGWASDVPVAVSLDDTGVLNVSINDTPLVTDFATGYTPTIGYRMGVSATGGNGADQRIDNIDIQANPTTITNTTTATEYPTLKAALNAASNGDIIELGAGIICEWGVLIPDELEVTIRGAGADQTCIDGQGQDWILRGQRGTFHLDGLTIANAFARVGNYAALSSSGSGAEWRITDCNFADNDGNLLGASTIVAYSNAQMKFERCRFMNNHDSAIAMVMVENVGTVTLTDCLFVGNDPRFHLIRTYGGSLVEAVNCTFSAGHSNSSSLQAQQTSSGITAYNCVFDNSNGTSVLGGPGIITAIGNLLPGATGDNIDGVPTFVDPTNGDYRLAQGSLGIDAADFDIYMASGGSTIDLNGDPRTHNDPGVSDIGMGSLTYLDMGACEFQGITPQPCDGDVTGNNLVDVDDLNAMLSAWSTSVGVGSPLDLANADGFVDVDDLNIVLGNWGRDCNTN